MITHTVQRGETLRTISDSYGYDYDQILQLNPYASPAPRADAIIQLVVPMTGDVLTGEADEPMTWGPTTECVSSSSPGGRGSGGGSYNFFQGEELSYLWKQPLWDDNHIMIYDYANSRDIDFTTTTVDSSTSLHSVSEGQSMLDQGLREGWITRNSGGSYDVSLTLYFRPQSWFYLGLLISGTTLLGLLGWLLWDWRRRKSLDTKS